MKRSIEPWAPAAFCAFISLIAVFASIRESGGWLRPVFFAFLPMCFVFVGGAIWRMQHEIRELRLRLAEVNAIQQAAMVPLRERRG